jgi:hypothetical protein
MDILFLSTSKTGFPLSLRERVGERGSKQKHPLIHSLSLALSRRERGFSFLVVLYNDLREACGVIFRL